MGIKLIQSLTTNTTQILFSSIPSTYTHLLLSATARTDGLVQYDYMYVRPNVNNDSSNQSTSIYFLNNSTANAENVNPVRARMPGGFNGYGTYHQTIEVFIANYKSTIRNKSMFYRGGSFNTSLSNTAYNYGCGWYGDNTAISSLYLVLAATNNSYTSTSQFNLYGIE